MSAYTPDRWRARYGDGVPGHLELDHETQLAAFEAAVERNPDAPAIHYFDGTLTYRELNDRAGAFAWALRERGFADGDRLAIYTQNNPAFVVGLVAAWKAGGAGVAVNPMNRHRELRYLLEDSGAVALLCLDELHDEVAREVLAGSGTAVHTVVTVSALDDQGRDDPRLFDGVSRIRTEGTLDLAELIRSAGDNRPEPASPSPGDLALLSYTSGTTGAPKGAMNTHGNMVFNAQVYRDWYGLGPDDVVLGVAPLFHITGSVAHVAISQLIGAPLVIAHRYEPSVMADVLVEHRPTFTIGALTVFISLMGVTGRDHWSSFRAVLSGGAPIIPSVNERFEEISGHYIHNAYGLTETSSPSHLVPFGARAPVDPGSGALSVGVPVPDTVVRVVRDDGTEADVGEYGELLTRGPQVVPAYWNKPEATAAGIPGGELHTGDIGFMDEEGWFYVVDRKKDMINASGYKVWPREVEDVLYEHPAVLEAAVVGVPDEYRGETVKAVVSLNPGVEVTPEEIIAFAKARLSAYKYPRLVEIMDELPKTPTGKILRRELR